MSTQTQVAETPDQSVGFWQGIALLAATDLCSFFTILPIVVLADVTGADKSRWGSPAVGIIAAMPCSMAVAWMMLRHWTVPIASLFSAPGRVMSRLPWVALGVAANLIIAVPVYLFIAAHWPWFAAAMRSDDLQIKGPAWVVNIALVIGAPLSEELLFRGVILRGMLRRYSVRNALLASAAVFAIAHVHPVKLPLMFIAGIGLGWLYVRTGSLWLPMAAHAMNNGSGALARSPGFPEEPHLTVWLALALIVAGGGFMLLAYRCLATLKGDCERSSGVAPNSAIVSP